MITPIPPMMSIEELRKKRNEENNPEVIKRSEIIRNETQKEAEKEEEARTAALKKEVKLCIQGVSGTYKDAVFPIEDGITIGREIGQANIIYPDQVSFISKLHCKVWVDSDGNVKIQDLGSSNGTFFDDDSEIEEGYVYKIKVDEGFYLGRPDEAFRVVRSL